MNDLVNVVDWSRAQFALTAMYHWLFVPLTIGLAFIVAIMESIYVRTQKESWKGITKFWMTIFGINFAIGVATGLILEFEFGTNWSNYSWFVGDIFGAPLAIEGIFAFFMEATFVAVMFFGWNRVSQRFHLVSTWLVAFGVSLSAYWILVANSWMQHPVGMEFDPAQMRNVMVDFAQVAFNPVPINKFFHAVMSGWCLAGIFVIGVSCWMLLRHRNEQAARTSIKIGAWVGLVGMILTMFTGDKSAVEVTKTQPMKLAAMEGLYKGEVGQSFTLIGVVNKDKVPGDNQEPVKYDIRIPKLLSILANHDPNSFVPGIDDIIAGVSIDQNGDTINTVSYADRIAMGKEAQAALADYDKASKAGDKEAMALASKRIQDNFKYFGYAYLDSPKDAVPPVALTFYAFRVMCFLGGFLFLICFVALFLSYRKKNLLAHPLICWVGIISIPLVWICSQAGWIVAEVGRQPWVINDLMPTSAAISDISASSVQFTFWMFAILFTALLVAEISIMIHYINKASKGNIEAAH